MSSPSPTPLPPGERKKRKNGLSHQGRGKRNKASPTEGREKKLVPSPLMEEGQDEGESLRCNPSWLLSIRSIKNIPVFSE